MRMCPSHHTRLRCLQRLRRLRRRWRRRTNTGTRRGARCSGPRGRPSELGAQPQRLLVAFGNAADDVAPGRALEDLDPARHAAPALTFLEEVRVISQSVSHRPTPTTEHRASRPQTINPRPSTLDPQPWTLNPRPSTPPRKPRKPQFHEIGRLYLVKGAPPRSS